jgi:putative phosphoesterase
VITDLENIAPLTVVCGNMDYTLQERNLSSNQILEFDHIKVGLSHILPQNFPFRSEKLRIYIHGHTHYPEITENSEGICFINPGSLTNPRTAPHRRFFLHDPIPLPSIAFLTIDDGIISSNIQLIKK